MYNINNSMASSSLIGEDSISSIHSLVIDEAQPSQSYSNISEQAAEYATQFVITSSTDTVSNYSETMRHDLLASMSQQTMNGNCLLDSSNTTDESQMPCGLEKLDSLSYKELQQIAMKLQYPGNMKGSVLKQLLRARYDGNDTQVKTILERHTNRYRRDRRYSSEDRPRRRRSRTTDEDPQWLPPSKRTHGYLSDDSSVYFGIAQSPISYDSSDLSQDQRSICTVDLGSPSTTVEMPPPPPIGPPSMQSIPSQPAQHSMQSPQAGLMPPPYSMNWMAAQSHMSWANHTWMPPLQTLNSSPVPSDHSSDGKKKKRKPRKSKNDTAKAQSWQEDDGAERERQEQNIRALQMEQQELMVKSWHKSQQEHIQSQQQLALAQNRDIQQGSSCNLPPPPPVSMPPPPPPSLDQDSTAAAMKFYSHLNAATHAMSTHATQNHLQPLHPTCYYPQAFNSQFRTQYVGPYSASNPPPLPPPPRYMLPPSQYPVYYPPLGQYAQSPPPPPPSPAPQLQQPPPAVTPGPSNQLDHTHRFPVLSSLLDRTKPINPPSCTVTSEEANNLCMPKLVRPRAKPQNCTVTRDTEEANNLCIAKLDRPKASTPQNCTVTRESPEPYLPANTPCLSKQDDDDDDGVKHGEGYKIVDMRNVPTNRYLWESFNRMHKQGLVSEWTPQEDQTEDPVNYSDQQIAVAGGSKEHLDTTLNIQDLSSRNTAVMDLVPTQTMQNSMEGVEVVSEDSADYDAAVAAHLEENLPSLNDNFLSSILSPSKKHLCCNQVHGCYEGFPNVMQCRVHEQYCMHRCVGCFLDECRWCGLLGQLASHIRVNHGVRLVSNEEAAHVVVLAELRNKHKVCFLQSAFERLFIIEVYFRGQVIHAAVQWIPEANFQKEEEAPLGTLEVVSVVDTQCHTWKGYVPMYPTNFQVPHGMLTNSIYPCLSLPLPWAYHSHISHIVIHVGLHMMPKHPSIMPPATVVAAAPSSPVRDSHTPSPQQPQESSQQQEEDESQEEGEHTEEENENMVILDDGSQT